MVVLVARVPMRLVAASFGDGLGGPEGGPVFGGFLEEVGGRSDLDLVLLVFSFCIYNISAIFWE